MTEGLCPGGVPDGRDPCCRGESDECFGAQVEDVLAAIGNVRIQFWVCPERHPRLPLRETVRWSGNVATCMDCGRTNRCLVCNSTDQTRVPERFRTHGPFCNDPWHFA